MKTLVIPPIIGGLVLVMWVFSGTVVANDEVPWYGTPSGANGEGGDGPWCFGGNLPVILELR